METGRGNATRNNSTAAPAGQRKQFTDAELREDLDRGLKPAEIAEKRGVSRQAVYKRVNQLGLTTTAAAVAPEESRRYVSRTIDAMEELVSSLWRVNLLMDACDDWLRDAADPKRYDIGARADEVVVTYLIPNEGNRPPERRKDTLQRLLAMVDESEFAGSVQRTDTRFADPRELILKTASEVRQIVGAAADLAKMLADARLMEEFRQALLEEIRQVSPEIATAIAERIRRRLILHGAYRGPDALPGA